MKIAVGPGKNSKNNKVVGPGKKIKIDKRRAQSKWLAIVLGRHFKVPVLLGIFICQYSPKSIVEFELCAKKAISGSYGIENSQNFLKVAKNV